MELLLNLAWLLLALPAFWLWRGSATASVDRKFTALQCVLALGCTLVVLFPVVSATDDLRAMRNETEESSISKRSLRQASNDKASCWKWQNPPALVWSANSSVESDRSCQVTPNPIFSVAVAHAIQRWGRAPPDSFLS